MRNDWAEVYALADPAMHGVIDQLEKYQLPMPEVGFLIQQQEEQCQIELAWPRKKVGIAIEKDDAIHAHRLGWKVISMRLFLMEPEQFFRLVR